MLNIFRYIFITVYFTNVSIAYLNKYNNINYIKKSFQLKQQSSDISDNKKQVLSDVSVLIKDLSSGKLEKDDFEKKISNTEMKFHEIKNVENLLLERNTLIGSSGLGFLLGLVIDLNLYNEINPLIPPLTSAILLTSTMYFVLNSEKTEVVAEYSKKYIGKNTVTLTESIKNQIELKKQNTIEYIQSIPDNTVKNINNYVKTKSNEIKTTIEQIPENVQNSIETKIDDIKKETNNAIKVQITNIQAIPENTLQSIKNSIQSTASKLIALPGILYTKTKMKIELKITGTQNKFNSKINSLKKTINELNPFSSRNENNEIKSIPKASPIIAKEVKRKVTNDNNTKPSYTTLKAEEVNFAAPKPETKIVMKPVVSNTPTKPSFSVGNFISKAPTTTALVKVETKQDVKNSKVVVVAAPKSSPVLKESNSNVDVRNLNSKLVKLIDSVSNKKPTAVKEIDIALGNYISSKIGPEIFYRELVVNLNSKDEAFTILPDIIGIVPIGPLKRALNSFYQQST